MCLTMPLVSHQGDLLLHGQVADQPFISIVYVSAPQLISLSAVRAEIELVRAKAAAAGSNVSSAASCGLDVASEAACESAHAAALLNWAQAVCAQYELPVCSFGACFSDGSVFCLLVRFMLGWGVPAHAAAVARTGPCVLRCSQPQAPHNHLHGCIALILAGPLLPGHRVCCTQGCADAAAAACRRRLW